MKIEYRKAGSEDAEMLIKIFNAAFYSDYMRFGVCPGYGKTVEMMEASIEDHPKYIILCDNIGKLLARALDVGVSGKNNTIFKIVDNFNNKELDSGFISGYDSLNHVRQIGDGSDQKEVYDMLNKTSEDVEIDFPHTASLLRIISKHYLTNSKTDFVTSELGPEVI